MVRPRKSARTNRCYNQVSAALITYEYPLIERVRTLLRLETLFARAELFINRTDPQDHHVALLSLFEILEVVGRAELKSDLLQELERQRQVMASFRSNPDADQRILSGVVDGIERAAGAIHGMSGKVGQHLRDNDWLMGIRQRAAIPGGACEFDLPSYHRWLHREDSARVQALQRWVSPMLPIRDGAILVLAMLRESGKPQQLSAPQGVFQQSLGGRVVQIVRIKVPIWPECVPEVSANRYALNIRFTVQGDDPRPRTVEQDVPFELTFCSL